MKRNVNVARITRLGDDAYSVVLFQNGVPLCLESTHPWAELLAMLHQLNLGQAVTP